MVSAAAKALCLDDTTGAPVFPLTLILSSRNFSKELMSMILSSTGLVQSMTNVWLFFLPLPAVTAGFLVGATITAHRSAARPPAAPPQTVREHQVDAAHASLSCQLRLLHRAGHVPVQGPSCSVLSERTGGQAVYYSSSAMQTNKCDAKTPAGGAALSR